MKASPARSSSFRKTARSDLKIHVRFAKLPKTGASRPLLSFLLTKGVFNDIDHEFSRGVL